MQFWGTLKWVWWLETWDCEWVASESWNSRHGNSNLCWSRWAAAHEFDKILSQCQLLNHILSLSRLTELHFYLHSLGNVLWDHGISRDIQVKRGHSEKCIEDGVLSLCSLGIDQTSLKFFKSNCGGASFFWANFIIPSICSLTLPLHSSTCQWLWLMISKLTDGLFNP